MLRFVTNSIPMISFKHKSNTRQIKIKTTRDLNERMSPWLQNIFNIKNPIVGFKVANSKYDLIQISTMTLSHFTPIRRNSMARLSILLRLRINSKSHVSIVSLSRI